MAATPEQTPGTESESMAEAKPEVDLQERVVRLEAENEELKRRSEELSKAAVPSARGRNAGAIAIVIVAAILLALAVPAVWLNRMVTDTDIYVETVVPLAEDPDIQNAVAAAASDALIERLDAQQRIENLLPENLQMIAIPVSQAADDFIAKQSVAFVRSDRFVQAWETTNRVGHKALVTAVTGRDTGVVGVQAGTITLDVGTLATEVQARLVDSGFELAARIPTSGINKQLVLYESPALAQMSSSFDLLSRLAYLIPLLGLGLVAAGVALAADRRKAVLWLGGALAIAAVLPLQALFLAQGQVIGQLYQLASIPTAAAQSAFEIIFRDLIAADRAVIALGAVLWVGAMVAGPSRWAIALRQGLSGGLSSVASYLALGRFDEWVAARKVGLRTAGVVLAVLVLLALPAPRTVESVLWLAGGYLVWLLAVELVGASPTADPGDELAAEDSGEPAEGTA